MNKLRKVFAKNTKTILDLSPSQAIELANIVFCLKGIKWTVGRVNENGYWLNGIDESGIKYYFRINEYFEIYDKKIFEPNTEKGETKTAEYQGFLGNIQLDWLDGVPYMNVVGWLLENGFNMFANYPAKQ
jgi:hypothetical protein